MICPKCNYESGVLVNTPDGLMCARCRDFGTDGRLKKRSKKSKWTNRRLFDKIIEKLGEKGVFPEILDYTLPEYESIDLTTCKVDCLGKLSIGEASASFEGADLLAIETLPITDARLRTAWDHDLYRIRLKGNDAGFRLTIQ